MAGHYSTRQTGSPDPPASVSFAAGGLGLVASEGLRFNPNGIRDSPHPSTAHSVCAATQGAASLQHQTQRRPHPVGKHPTNPKIAVDLQLGSGNVVDGQLAIGFACWPRGKKRLASRGCLTPGGHPKRFVCWDELLVGGAGERGESVAARRLLVPPNGKCPFIEPPQWPAPIEIGRACSSSETHL
jgi:hypothetical protein